VTDRGGKRRVWPGVKKEEVERRAGEKEGGIKKKKKE
jgi:hypothetical protein